MDYFSWLCHWAQGHYDESIAQYKKALVNFPCTSNFKVYEMMGFFYVDSRQYDKALQAYNSALDTYDKIPSLANTRGYLGAFCKGIKWDDLANLYLWRGFSNTVLHNYDQAIADFTECIRLQSGVPFQYFAWTGYPQYLRSICYYAGGQQELAQRDIEQLKKDGYWGYVGKEDCPNSSNWYSKIPTTVRKSEIVR